MPSDLLERPVQAGNESLLDRVLLLNELKQLCYSSAEQAAGSSFFDALLRRLDLSYDCAEADRLRIPARGPVVVVANHPYGLADGLILGSLLLKIRPDIKFMANSLLSTAELEASRNYIIPVNPFGGPESATANRKGLRQSVYWLKSGGLLIMFPAGEVSSLRFPAATISDPAWSETAVRLVRMTNAVTVPVFFHGSNSPAFQLAGLLHPGLRTILLPRELLNKRGRKVRVAVGSPITASSLARHSTARAAADYLQWRTQMLQARRDEEPAPTTVFRDPFPFRSKKTPGAIIPAVDAATCRCEVQSLPGSQKLLEQGDNLVCFASAQQIPQLLREIGRLREISFRHAGEGTGEPVDLDLFDAHYLHLFVWNQKRSEVVGAYRFAGTDEVLSRFGPQGLYTSTLFRFKRDFLSRVDPALELGRSFVRPEYQRSFAPLLLLWKGIGHYVARHPRYRILFGPVSISDTYSPASRALMVSFLKERHFDADLAPSVKPKHKYQARALRSMVANADELSDVVSDLEPDRKGLPVLLRQYLNVGGQILDFSVDRHFSSVLDGLIVVDLAKTNARLVDKYLGKAGAERFRRWHGIRAACV
ncbi:MAG: lysophospholipid acyltransferase family protein [Acidobacteriia bacterium]|nr:lysophospholipid acyltransferase family protein [Terriglobia bacterium]